jgi:hypothetical protein
MRKLLLTLTVVLLLATCSKNYYPWTDSKLPKWVMDSLKDDDRVLVEHMNFGPVNKKQPFLWCYKYKNVVIIYDIDEQGHITKKTVWKK